MREILFRGKRVRDDMWAYGDLRQLPDQNLYGIMGKKSFTNHEAVYPETVGQYAGLTDKNGTRIFEGDIIKSKEYGRCQGGKNFSGYDIFEVRFVDGAFVIRNSDRLFYLLLGADKEVIGNIFENPDLLEVEE